MGKNIIILLGLLVAVAALILGIHQMGSQVDRKAKYQHPITKPGGHW